MADQPDTTMSLILLLGGGVLLVGGALIYFVLKRRLRRPRNQGKNKTPPPVPQMGFGAPPAVPMNGSNAPPPPFPMDQGGAATPFSGGPPPGMVPEGREYSGNKGGGGDGTFISPAPSAPDTGFGGSFFNQVRQSLFGGGGGNTGLPSGWKSTFDRDTGDTYFYNKSTGQVQWTPP